MKVLRCHQDIQVAVDESALRAYVAKYVSKFSDAATEDWYNDAAQGDAVAMTVLTRYRPLEPEMVLQTFGHSLRQWHLSTASRGRRDFIVPWPGKPQQPPEIGLYEKCKWRSEDMNLLDFLR
eukprot:10035714-Prorocentrum_lima.AAC.1